MVFFVFFTSITIGNSVISIDSDAFYCCRSLMSITIHDSVTSIGNYAFSVCSSLTTINYTVTETQWSNISKGDYWDYENDNYTINYNYKED